MPSTRRRFVTALAATPWLASATARGDIPRLERIRRRVEPHLRETFADRGLGYPPRRVHLRAFKHERILELWAADRPDDPLTLVESHPICAASGELGPKRVQGDLQVPEGVYSIHRYNAWSGFHLSLRVDYPNDSDKVRGTRWNLGGAIMVHGGCASIGCIAIEDGPIERVFLPTLDARRAGLEMPSIHVFPTRFDEHAWDRLEAAAGGDETRLALWGELEPIERAFAEKRRVPVVTIDPRTGAYALARE